VLATAGAAGVIEATGAAGGSRCKVAGADDVTATDGGGAAIEDFNRLTISASDQVLDSCKSCAVMGCGSGAGTGAGATTAATAAG
jgi:hypothetical protein